MSQQSSPFMTNCFRCHASFDVFQARWCDCVVRESSIVCPSCGDCFCKAPASYKSGFWQEAPTCLLRTRMREMRRDSDGASQPSQGDALNDAPLVLVIDDSRTVRAAARVALEDAGYRVAEAADAVEGLRLVHETSPALVLSDALMPRLDGREMCRILKNDPRTSGVRVVLMTALYTAPRYRTEAIKSFRVDEYVAKPLTSERLLQVVAKLLFGHPVPSRQAGLLQAGTA